MKLDLTGKRALITGAGGGIGRHTARLFAEAGAKVFISDINSDAVDDARDKISGLGGMVLDMTQPTAMAEFFEAGIDYLGGGLDIMVNNVGSAGPTAPIEEISLEEWTTCVTLNLTTAFQGTQLAIPHLREAGGGSIVNLSSAAGKFGFPMRSPYSASKWGIVGLTRTIALELGSDRIRCNCIQPGPVEGERIDGVVRAKAKSLGISENEMRSNMTEITALKSFVDPRDISSMILYLCSDLGRTVTGQAISVDSGLEGLV